MSSMVNTLPWATFDPLDGLVLFTLLAFLGLLITKELASNMSSPRLRTLSRGLNIGIVPLGLAFAFIALARLARALA
jgi:hypothetical protein